MLFCLLVLECDEEPLSKVENCKKDCQLTTGFREILVLWNSLKLKIKINYHQINNNLKAYMKFLSKYWKLGHKQYSIVDWHYEKKLKVKSS